MNQVSRNSDSVISISEQMGPDSLSTRRAEAAKRFAETGFPTTRMEDWKYTDLAPARDISMSALAEPRPAIPNQVPVPDIDAHWLVIRNGAPEIDALPEASGLSIRLLSEADVDIRYDLPLADLNLALLSDGLHVRVARNADFKKPIGLLFVTETNEQPVVAQGRVILDVDDGAEAAFIEMHATAGDGERYSNVFVELNIGNSAQVDYARLQNSDLKSVHTNHLRVAAGRDAHLRHFACDGGGRLVRNDLVIDIAQPGATVEFDGLYLADTGQHIDNHTRVDHRVGPASSRQEYRGIIRGRAVWNGKAVVHEGADGTDAQQANHNLLVAERAEIDAKPELEIYAEDVKCSHGTTVGQLDDDAVFYLRTRGLDENQSRQLMTQAFAMGVVKRCPIASCADWLDLQVSKSLETLVFKEDL